MGTQKKQLSKYTKFYEDLGYEVHCVVNDLKTTVFPPTSNAQKIAEFIDGPPEGRPVFVHAFSVGTGIYGLLLDTLRDETERFDKFRKNVTGVVFDSGPASNFPHDVGKGLHTVCPGATARRLLSSATEGIFTCIFRIEARITLIVASSPRR